MPLEAAAGKPAPLADATFALLPTLSVVELRSSSASFKEKTCNPDGLHPRSLSLLSDECLEGLAQILAVAEAVGDFPDITRDAVISLLRKKTGGCRAIGFFRGPFRVWGRARRGELIKWEETMAEQSHFNVGKGRCTTDAVWRRAAKAAHHTNAGEAAAAIFKDLQEFYEHIDHELLAETGLSLGYPPVVLRMCLAS